MEEQKVSFKVAKLAKQKGFKEDSCNYCLVFDKTQNKELKLFYDETSKLHSNFVLLGLIPTQSLLQKWLRDNHNVYIEIQHSYRDLSKYTYYVYKTWEEYCKKVMSVFNNKLVHYDTYEDALEDALEEALNLLQDLT